MRIMIEFETRQLRILLTNCKTNFWLSPSQIRQFLKSDEIHPANEIYPTLGAAVGGYRRQESVMAYNRLLPLCRHKEEASEEQAGYFPSVEI